MSTKSLSDTAQNAYEQIRKRIVGGLIGPGDRLTELHLSAELSVSRTPIREALKKLVEERWLEYLPNRGMRVRIWKKKDIADNFHVRKILECEAVFLAARLIDEVRIDELETLNRQLTAVAELRTPEAISKMTILNLEFHQKIWKASGNRMICEILQRNINVPTMASTYQHYNPEQVQASLEEHQQMLDSFRKRDPDAARLVMQTHLDRAAGIFS